MCCFLENENGTQVALLMFKRDQLLYDVKNYAYIEGSVMDTESNHNRHMVEDVGEVGNVDRVTRVFDLCIAKCKELLYPYTKHNISMSALDDKLSERGVYGIVMKVPLDYSQTTLNLQEKLIHEFLVCEAVADWMSITNPAKAETWKVKASAAEGKIKESLNSRMMRRRRRLAPF